MTAGPPTEGQLRVLSAGTMGGVGPEAHLAAAQAAGFDAVSLRPGDVARWCDGATRRSVADLRRLLDGHGLVLAELDPVTGWAYNRRGRRWPATGQQHPERVLGRLRDRGWSGPVGVEVFGSAAGDPAGRARRAATALEVVLAPRPPEAHPADAAG